MEKVVLIIESFTHIKAIGLVFGGPCNETVFSARLLVEALYYVFKTIYTKEITCAGTYSQWPV